VRSALEHGVARSAEDAEPGRFPQVSGIQFTFDASRPAGSRILDVKVNGLPLDPAKKYTIATSSFIYVDGGDGYSMFKDLRALIPPEKGQLDSDILRRAIGSVRTIAPKVEGRIKRLDQPQQNGSDCK